jgi:cytochrome c peroxidase
MKKALSVYVILGLLVFASCNSGSQPSSSASKPQAGLTPAQEQELYLKARNIFKPLPEVAENPDNPVTPEKVKLGKMLYFDKRLSAKGNNSCNSCHNLATFGVDNLPTSPGDEGKNGTRNSPTTLNAALHTMQFWDGRAKDVEEQAGMPILNPVEMNIPSEDFLIKRLKGIDLYKTLFAAAYPDSKNPITYENVRKAIAAFERTLLTPSRFDEYLNGKKDALTAEEKKGMLAFFDAGCNTCHNGVAVGGNSLQKFGAFYDYRQFLKGTHNDEGRKEVTKNEFDKDFFKTPSLRNVTKTHPYFHDGSIPDLESAIHIMAKLQLDRDLSDEQIASIKAFLQSMESDLPAAVKQPPAELGNFAL